MRIPIDLSTWKRADLFCAYLGTDFPYISLSCNLDISKLYEYVKGEGLSLYFSLIYLMTKAADKIENFRYRFEEGKPFIIDKNTAFATHLMPGEEIFSYVECDDYLSMEEFARKNRAKADIPERLGGLAAISGRLDIISFSCLPWVKYTHFIRTIKKDGVDCIPKMAFGKFTEEGGKVIIPFTIQTHHGLMDGYHVGKFFERVEESSVFQIKIV